MQYIPQCLCFLSWAYAVHIGKPMFFLVGPNRANQQTYVFPRDDPPCKPANLCFFSWDPTVQTSKPMFFLVLPNNAHSGGNLTLDPHMEFDNIDLPQSRAPLRFSQRSLSNYPHGPWLQEGTESQWPVQLSFGDLKFYMESERMSVLHPVWLNILIICLQGPCPV